MLFLGEHTLPPPPPNSETLWTFLHYPEISALVGDACFLLRHLEKSFSCLNLDMSDQMFPEHRGLVGPSLL